MNKTGAANFALLSAAYSLKALKNGLKATITDNELKLASLKRWNYIITETEHGRHICRAHGYA